MTAFNLTPGQVVELFEHSEEVRDATAALTEAIQAEEEDISVLEKTLDERVAAAIADKGWDVETID